MVVVAAKAAKTRTMKGRTNDDEEEGEEVRIKRK